MKLEVMFYNLVNTRHFKSGKGYKIQINQLENKIQWQKKIKLYIMCLYLILKGLILVRLLLYNKVIFLRTYNYFSFLINFPITW